MELIADRFVADDSARSTFAQDLATGQRVWMEFRGLADPGEQRRWVLRCDDLFQLRHPAVATLVDYGAVGMARQFEAWSCYAHWTDDPKVASAVVAHATRYLECAGFTAGNAVSDVFASGTGPVVVPAADAGYRNIVEPVSSVGERTAPGIALVARPAVIALSEMLRLVDEQRPKATAIWGPAGSGVSTAVLTLAREARVSGFVPIDVRLADGCAAPTFAGRTLFLIDRCSPADAVRALLRVTLRSPRPHLCMVTARHEVRGFDGVSMGRVDEDALVRAVKPSCESTLRVAQAAAARAGGLPGNFARALWGRWLRVYGRPLKASSRVAELRARYGGDAPSVVDSRDDPSAGIAPTPTWTPPADVADLRHKAQQAERLFAEGRHAPGLRLLRQTVSALARRRAWTDAAQGGLCLATELLSRGRVRDALRTVDEVREHAQRAGDADLVADAAIVTGDAWIDAARLDEAERILRAGMTAVRNVGDRVREQQMATSLARCLFWRADVAAATALLDQTFDQTGIDGSIRRWRLRARIAAAEGDSVRALAALEQARRLAPAGACAVEADLLCTSAFVRLRIGDLDAVDRESQQCVAAARAARRPMRVLAALLLQAEAHRRRGKAISVERRRVLERLARTATPLLRARWDLLVALAASRDEPATIAQFAASSPLKGLAVFVAAAAAGPAGSELDPVTRELVGLLHVLHDADDEIVVLSHVCARVRRQLHAAAVAFIAPNAGRWDSIAADGPRMETDIADRVVCSGVVAGPHRLADRLEAAAPVHYGGAPIAALCIRWTPGGAVDDTSRASSVLSMAATAAAPLVHAVLAQRRAHTHIASSSSELIGAAPMMTDLRRMVERAASAPFAVLIEGESGSGKELVARGIHRAGPRRDRTFCTLNCAALPDDLVESELFGHARGAFTGAMADRPGVFEEAHGGTLFLDEVGELSLRAQAKLLRVIQEGELRRIGENISRRIDVRIVAATNRDLRRETEAGRFRLDLLYRLDVIRITVPPLRDRREDVAALVEHFWNDAARRVGSRATLSTAARAALGSYDWPGNVRELQNVLAALAVRCPKRGVVPPSALPPHVAAARRPDVWRLDAARRTFEEGFVRAALVRAGGHRSRAADELGLTRQGLNKLMSRLGIE